MAASTKSRIILMASLLAAAPALADAPTGIQAGTSGGVHGEVQIAKADYVTPQRQIGHQIGSGEPIYMGDQISTGAGGGLQVMLLDQTVMTLGQNAKMTIDEMVYDPKSGTGKLNFNVTQGAFRFVSGQIAKANPENVNIKTPMATIGIRGTLVGGSVDSGNTLVALLGPGDQTNTSARHGAIEVTTPSGTVSISRTGYSTVITPGAPPSPPAPVTAEQLQRFGQAGAGSSGSAASTQSSSGGSTASTTTTSTTNGGTTADSVSGEGLAKGDAISNVVTKIVTTVQQQDKTVADNSTTSKQTTVAASNSSTADDSNFSSLYGKSVSYRRASFYYYTSDGVGFNNGLSASDTLTYNRNSSWTFTDPNNDDSVTFSNWSSSSNDTLAGLPSGTKYASATASNGNTYNAYEFSGVSSLNYTKFGLWLGGSSLSWSSNLLSADSATFGAYSFGVATPTASMPSSGYATYTGTLSGFGAEGSNVYAYTTSITLNANFTSHSISGSTATLSASNFTGVTGSTSTPFTQLTFSSGTISSNSFSGSSITVTGSSTFASNTATYNGQFNGSTAQEVGGTYKVSSSTNYLVGAFGAARGSISTSPP